MSIKENLKRIDIKEISRIIKFVNDWSDLNQGVLENERVTENEKIVYMNFRIKVLKEELSK